MANKIAARLTAAAVAAAMGISAVPMIANAEDEIKYEYGVFLNSSNSKKDIEKMSQYRIIVLDAQGFEREDIMALKKTGHTVYSYINLGSVENWRDYYNDYADITFADYEDWDDERWVNSAETKWQTFQYDLAKNLIGKGIDGFFVDNIDVYYVAKEQPDRHDKEGIDPVEVFDGVTTILKSYKSLKTSTGDSAYVLINGGDTSLQRILRSLEMYLLAIQVHMALFCRVNTCDNLDERRFARSVLSHQSMYFSAAQLKLYVIQRFYTGENLGNTFKFQNQIL